MSLEAPKRPKIGDLHMMQMPQGEIYNTDEEPHALDALESMRVASIAKQHGVLAKSKIAFGNEVQKILDAMAHPDAPGSIHAVIADSKFNVHLDDALAAAEKIISISAGHHQNDFF